MHGLELDVHVCLGCISSCQPASKYLIPKYLNSYRSVNQWVEFTLTLVALNCKCLCGQRSEAESETCYFPTGAT